MSPEQPLWQVRRVWGTKVMHWEGNTAWRDISAGSKASTAKSCCREDAHSRSLWDCAGGRLADHRYPRHLLGEHHQQGNHACLACILLHLLVSPPESALAPDPSGCPSMGHIHPARQGMRVCLLGDRAVPTENFCNIKCLQPQDRKMVIKSLTALMIQGFYASHPRATAWLQHHKPQMCFTHGSSSASWENPHCKWGHWGVGRSSHPPKTSQAGSNLSARCLP